MKSFRLRRQRSIAITAGLVAALWVAHVALRLAFFPVALITGGVLLALVLLLTLFNARKKLPFLPLLKASVWMQFHAYAGWLSVFVFLLHVGWHWPQGALDQVLAAVFVVVAGSGVLGLLLSRTLPPRLTASGDPLVYERIPGLSRRLLEHTDERICASEEATGSTTLADFHRSRLRPYLESRPGWFAILVGQDRRDTRILAELKSTGRYLSPDEQPLAAELADIIEAKRDLDFQYSGQRLLKTWLFVHIPLTYSLIILAVVHACIAISHTSSLW